MKIQSLSVVVPNKACVNNCQFCVAHMKDEDYPNMMDDNKPFYDLYLKDYLKRLEFARDNGCNTVMLTGNSEPQQNRNFLTYFGLFMMIMQKPFRNIEIQTTGVFIDEPYLRFLRNHVGVNTLSLSISSLMSKENQFINGTSDANFVELYALCHQIKIYDFNLRISINLTDKFNKYIGYVSDMLDEIKHSYLADQITFRILYSSNLGTRQDNWIKQHKCSDELIDQLREYIKEHGRALEKLEYGAQKYSLNDMCVVLDNDCMSTEVKDNEDYKYLILRPDCKLYSKWDDKASLIF